MLSTRIGRVSRAWRSSSNTRLTRTLLVCVVAALARPTLAQTIDDSIMMPKGVACVAVMYSHDSWEKYWEGDLERTSGNIGSITTQSFGPGVDYGITDRLNVIAMLPYVWTRASQGTLQGQSGFQDLTLALKYNLLETAFTGAGTLRSIVVASAGIPVSDYVPDLLPLSIGSASKRASARLTLLFQAKQGWFLEGTGAYTWRDNVTLDRPAYFTGGQLYLTDQVAMPDVLDFMFTAGYQRGGFRVPFAFTRQITQGGGDIRRQDMPFPSNKMDASKLDLYVKYDLPQLKSLSLKLGGTQVVTGRNVGRGTTISASALYTFNF